MTTTSVALESPGLERLELDDWQAGWVVKSVEVGAPQVRESVSVRPSGHGTIDRTAFVGARAVTASVVAVAGPAELRQLVDRLAPFLDPGRRSTLTLGDGGDTRQLQVRSDGDTPIPWENAGFLQLAVGWVTVGYPFWLGTERAIVLSPFAPATTTGGPTPPVTPPFTLPNEDRATAGLVVNAGSVPAHWTATVYGPAVDVGVENLTTGERVVLTGLILGDGQVAVIDSLSRTVTVDGESRFAAVNAAVSTWWTLPPGRSQLSVPVTSWLNPARVWFRYRDTYYA